MCNYHGPKSDLWWFFNDSLRSMCGRKGGAIKKVVAPAETEM